MNLQIFQKTSTTLLEHTAELVDYFAGTKVILYTSGDKILIGAPFPFNTLYVKPSVVNAVTATPTIEIWDGDSWVAVKRIVDGTATAGVPFAKAGQIQFVPDRNLSAWVSCDTQKSDGSEYVTGLGGVCLYDQYWMRLSYSATLTATTAFAYIGHLFLTSDLALESEHPIFSRSSIKTAIKSGKSDWEEQRYLATGLVIDDLISKNILLSGEQILDPSRLASAMVSKTAQLIYAMLGDDYADQAKISYQEYERRIKNPLLSIDRNDNAILDSDELTTREGRLYR